MEAQAKITPPAAAANRAFVRDLLAQREPELRDDLDALVAAMSCGPHCRAARLPASTDNTRGNQTP